MSRDVVSCLPASLAPRGLSRVQAAEYVGIGPTKFDEMVRDGRMPRPKRIDGRTVWDRLKLDEAFGTLDDDGAASAANEWDKL
jgi:predicted DNA-binding transcriptional regulator AlpA